MAGERKDGARSTNPGVGPASAPVQPAAPAAADADVVDFDALNAALGAAPAPPLSSSPMTAAPATAASDGRSSATYSSARPHTIPPSHHIAVDAPAVIVATDETIQTGPPVQMTLPMDPKQAALLAAGPMRPPSPSNPQLPTPQPFTNDTIQTRSPKNDAAGRTIQMPNSPRRPRVQTVVVRRPGPSRGQKFLVFLAMLLVFLASGVGVLLYYRPAGINLDAIWQKPAPKAAPTPTHVPSAAPIIIPSVVPSMLPAASVSIPIPSASASGKKPPTKPQR